MCAMLVDPLELEQDLFFFFLIFCKMPSYTSMHNRVNVNIFAQSEANELLSLDPWCMCPLV